MSTASHSNLISSDKPLTDPQNDRLGYAPFAKHLADAISQMVSAEGLVIAIYASWGSGKTTLLNFVVHYLEQKPIRQQPIIVHFNPWWFSGHEDLTRRFFDQLQSVLGKWESIAKSMGTLIAELGDIISETPIPYARTGKIFARWLGGKHKSVPELKAKIADVLKQKQKRILVVIDDIDRLSSDEIRQLFTVIKAVADFPSVVYLIAFDKNVVVKALQQMQSLSGEIYLEKIVQVPFDLPLPDKASLRNLLFERLDAILEGTNEALDQTYWANVYLEGIDHYINTPRDVVRLTNTLGVAYPAVKNEVNPVDFIAIEAIRVFCPLLYEMIRKNPEMYVGPVDALGYSLPAAGDHLKSFHDSWLSQIPEGERESVKSLLKRLFPKLESVWGNTRYGANWESNWRKHLRICSPDLFPVYFRFALQESGFSNSEIKTILSQVCDAKAFGQKLLELAKQKRPDGTTRLRAFLERLEDYTRDEISTDCIRSVLETFFDIGDQLLRPEDERRDLLGFGNDVIMGRVTWQLLRRLGEEARFDALKDAMAKGKATFTVIHEIASLGLQHGKYGDPEAAPENERLINTQHLEELERFALEKIRAGAREGSLIHCPHLQDVLNRWHDWAGDDEVKQWTQTFITSDEGLAEFLPKFLLKTFSQSVSDVIGKSYYRLDPKWFEPFLEPTQIIDRVRSLAQDKKLPENQKIAVRQFIREYELRQEGKDPSNILYWRGTN